VAAATKSSSFGAEHGGFSVHARVSLGALDRNAWALRGPIETAIRRLLEGRG
jgi:hypothetical protein